MPNLKTAVVISGALFMGTCAAAAEPTPPELIGTWHGEPIINQVKTPLDLTFTKEGKLEIMIMGNLIQMDYTVKDCKLIAITLNGATGLVKYTIRAGVLEFKGNDVLNGPFCRTKP